MVDFLKQRLAMRAVSCLLLAWPLAALGGAQIYEPLADSVRQRLSAWSRTERRRRCISASLATASAG